MRFYKGDGKYDVAEDYSKLAKELDKALSDGRNIVLPSGKLYEVELAPEQDEYLLWDRPLSEQSDKVKSNLKAFVNVDEMSGWAKLSGRELYRAVQERNGLLVGSDKAASEYLHSLGIRGIKYLDGSSRGKGEGNFNYVIFDDKDISITAKFSRAPKYVNIKLIDIDGDEVVWDGDPDKHPGRMLADDAIREVDDRIANLKRLIECLK